ncbi:MAG TPA: hypothetical protein VFN39_09260 [Gemmatimonadaceae bacterium]|nr:hypothetical protein [Gemmatimonadaceae bacterium]
MRCMLLAGIALSLAACEWKGNQLASNELGGVTMSLAGSHSASDAFLTIGDVDTVLAGALSGGWPIHTLCESRGSPERFTFHSSDPAVAIVRPTGVLRTTGIGSTLLTVTYQNVDSPPVRLSVSPPAVELRAFPETIDATTGDSIALTITALDEAGQSVARVIFRIGPDTSYWAVTSVPREGSWRLETPRILHMRADRAGVVHLTAYSENDHPERRMQTHAVAVTVHDP